MDINPLDLKIEVIPNHLIGWRNNPNTEVKITYLPTGLTVRCNKTKSLEKNKHICIDFIKNHIKSIKHLTE